MISHSRSKLLIILLLILFPLWVSRAAAQTEQVTLVLTDATTGREIAELAPEVEAFVSQDAVDEVNLALEAKIAPCEIEKKRKLTRCKGIRKIRFKVPRSFGVKRRQRRRGEKFLPYSLHGDKRAGSGRRINGRKLKRLRKVKSRGLQRLPISVTVMKKKGRSTFRFLLTIATENLLPPPSTPQPTPPSDPADNAEGGDESVGGEDARARMMRLLPAFRKQEATGVNCTFCHAPDAFDLAMLNYSDETIMRRALPHVDAATSDKIVQLVHAVRDVYGITDPPDPMEFRPFQPGGRPLPGETIREQDLNFGRQLRDNFNLKAVTLDRPIRSFEEAEQVLQDVLRINLSDVRVGFKMNRWTEDSFHGDEHNTIADWIPDLPMVPNQEVGGAFDKIVALQEAYIDSPTDENLFGYLTGLFPEEEPALLVRMFPGSWLVRNKFKSVQMATHNFRRSLLAGRSMDDPLRDTWFIYKPERGAKTHLSNPIWDLGDEVRIRRHSRSIYCDRDEPEKSCFNWPKEASEKVENSPNPFRDQVRNVMLPWFWIGWMHDEGLGRISGSNSTRSSEYFAGAALSSGFEPTHEPGSHERGNGQYLLHMLFHKLRQNAVRLYVRESWNEAEYFNHSEKGRLKVTDRKDLLPVLLQPPGFVYKSLNEIIKDESPEYQDLSRRLVANLYLALLFKLEHAIDNDLPVFMRASSVFDPDHKLYRTMLHLLGKTLREMPPQYRGDGLALIERLKVKRCTLSHAQEMSDC